jgi:protein-S-isoprenylcysteine O-methyltransferase Ste14
MKSKALPTTYFEVFFVLLIASHFVVPSARVVRYPYRWGGILFIIAGIVANLWADRLFKKEWTTVKPYERPHVLVTCGPFRLSRHPMYWGMASILLGSAVISGSLITFLFPVLFMLLMRWLFIPYEDRNMEDAFGQKYIDYKNRVRL